MFTGMLFVQPPEHGRLLHVSELVGAAESTFAVKPTPALESPALFCAVTLADCVPAELSNV
jgi:hypothetical protein